MARHAAERPPLPRRPEASPLSRLSLVALGALAASLAEGRAHVDAALWAGAQHLVADPDHAAVDRTGDAVQHLHVELREHESLVHTGVPDVALGGRVHHVPDLEALDGLVLGHAPAAVAAADDGGVAVPVLGAPVVAALGWHPDLLSLRAGN